jgi:hypothetical protein
LYFVHGSEITVNSIGVVLARSIVGGGCFSLESDSGNIIEPEFEKLSYRTGNLAKAETSLL